MVSHAELLSSAALAVTAAYPGAAADAALVKRVWKSLCAIAREQLEAGRAVRVPGLGVFTFTRNVVPSGNKGDKVARAPAFVCHSSFASSHALRVPVVNADQRVATVDLNLAHVAVNAGIDRALVGAVLSEVLRAASAALHASGAVTLDFLFASIDIVNRALRVSFSRSLCETVQRREDEEKHPSLRLGQSPLVRDAEILGTTRPRTVDSSPGTTAAMRTIRSTSMGPPSPEDPGTAALRRQHDNIVRAQRSASRSQLSSASSTARSPANGAASTPSPGALSGGNFRRLGDSASSSANGTPRSVNAQSVVSLNSFQPQPGIPSRLAAVPPLEVVRKINDQQLQFRGSLEAEKRERERREEERREAERRLAIIAETEKQEQRRRERAAIDRYNMEVFARPLGNGPGSPALGARGLFGTSPASPLGGPRSTRRSTARSAASSSEPGATSIVIGEEEDFALNHKHY